MPPAPRRRIINEFGGSRASVTTKPAARILPSNNFVRFHLPRFAFIRRLLEGRPRATVAAVALLAVVGFARAGWLTWFSYDLTTGLPDRAALRGMGDMAQATTLFDAQRQAGLHDLQRAADRSAAVRSLARI